jgi:hypothetical protein
MIPQLVTSAMIIRKITTAMRSIPSRGIGVDCRLQPHLAHCQIPFAIISRCAAAGALIGPYVPGPVGPCAPQAGQAGPVGRESSSHLPRMVAPHFSHGTSDGPRSQCGQATIVPPEKASEASQSDRPQCLQAPRELKSWKWSHLGHCTAKT